LIGDDYEISASQLDTATIIIERQTTSEFGTIEAFNLYRGTLSTFQNPDSFGFVAPQTNPLTLNLDQYLTPDDTNYVYFRVNAVSRTIDLDEYRCYTNPIWIKISPDSTPDSVTDLCIWIVGSDVYLDWGNSPLATHYNIYRSQNPSFSPTPEHLLDSAASSDYIDSNVLNASGSNYFYAVTAIN
jgi:hypothetical protein